MAKPVTVHTIESLKAKTVEIGDCWIWQGYFANKTPQVYWDGKVMSVRRVIKELQTGKKAYKNIYISTKCGEEKCINPDHYRYSTMREHMILMAKNANPQGIKRRMKLREAAKKRGLIKLTDEQVSNILMSDESGPVLAARFNVTRGLINKIRNGSCRFINKQISNPFAGLMQ